MAPLARGVRSVALFFLLAVPLLAQVGPVRLQVSTASASVPAGETAQFTATKMFFRNGTLTAGQDVTAGAKWTTSSATIATVDSAGLVTAHAKGTVTVMARSGPFRSNSFTLTVTSPILVGITVLPGSPSIPKGLTQQFSATGKFSDGSSQDITGAVTWSSQATSVATIASSGGLAIAVNNGSSLITAQDPISLISGSTTMNVRNAVLQNISVAPTAPSIPKGLTQQFTATAHFSDGTSSVVTNQVKWNDNAPATASITSTGLATGLAIGSANISVTLNSVTSNTAVLTISNATLTGITISPASASVAAGFTKQLKATGTFTSGPTQDITNQVAWSSTNTTAATINSATGLATGVTAGQSTTIKATMSGQTGTATLNVTNAVLQSITVTPANKNVPLGLTQQYTATGNFSDTSTLDLTNSVTWIALDNSVAIISQAGVATALGQGSTTIRAISGTTAGSTTINVVAPVLESIAISPANINVPQSSVVPYSATGIFSDNSTQDLTATATWSAVPGTHASVTNPGGVVKGIALGADTIKATSGSVTGSTGVTVVAVALQSIEVLPANPLIAAGFTQQFTAIGTFNDGTSKDITGLVTWNSATTGTATITSGGLATGVSGPGSSLISATDPVTHITGSTLLSVSNATLQSIKVTPTTASVPAGITVQFTATGTFSDGTTENLSSQVSWKSASSGTATISSTGLATAVAGGSSGISAKFGAITSNTATLTVTSATLSSIMVTPSPASVPAGFTLQFTATGHYSDSTTQDITAFVAWSSTNTTAATITPSGGLATGVTAGQSTTIKAQLSGQTGSSSLSVTSATLSSLGVTPPNPSVPKGLTQQFAATGTFSDLSTLDMTNQVTWVALNSSVAAISQTGLATALAQGSSTVRAFSGTVVGSDGMTVTAPVLVGIAVQPARATLAAGSETPYSAIGLFSDNSQSDITTSVTWSASPAGVVTISPAGVVTAVGAGGGSVTASSGTIHSTTSVTVVAKALQSITVLPSNPVIAAGFQQQFQAIGNYNDGTSKDITASVTWNSQTTSVVTINSATGLASAVANGSSLITAMDSATSIVGSTTMHVTNATLASITVTPRPSISLPAGISQQFTATGTFSDSTTEDLTRQVVWGSSNTNAAIISSTGLATTTANTGQSTTINATAGAISDLAPPTLTVSAATLQSIAISPANGTLAAGFKQQYTATGTYSAGPALDITNLVTWSSTNTTAATISAGGLATAVTAGQGTTIKAVLGAVTGTANLAITNATLQSIAVTPPSANVPVGLTKQYTATGTFSDASTLDLTSQSAWIALNNSVAVISQTGLATSVGQGGTTIRASHGAIVGSASFMGAAPVVVGIAVTPANATLAAGSVTPYTATGIFSDNSTSDITASALWGAAPSAQVSVTNPGGVVTAVAAGPGTVSAMLGSVTGSTGVTVVPVKLTSITVTPATPRRAAGFKLQFHATGHYNNGTTQDITNSVTWNSQTTSVATINGTGLATAVTAGTSLISATDPVTTAAGSTTLTVTNAKLQTITVTPNPSPNPVNLPAGQTVQFTATGGFSDGTTADLTAQVIWSTTNPNGATITSSGLATAGTAGQSTTINATSGTISDTNPPTLTVTSATLTSITVLPANSTLAAGFQQQYTAIGHYSDASTLDLTSQVTWNSTNTSAATITQPGGLATGVASGSTTIQATLGSVTGQTGLTVTGTTLVSIVVTPSNPPVPAGLTQPYTATGHFSDNSTLDLTTQVTWVALDNTVALISQSGVATAVGQGTTTIRAVSGTVIGNASITVTPPVLVSIAVSPANLQLPLNSSRQYTALGLFSDNSTQDLTASATWSATSGTGTATVTPAGVVTATGLGAATVNAQSGSTTGSTGVTIIPVTLVSITVLPKSPDIHNGFNQQFQALGTFNDGSSQDITNTVVWGSTNSGVATIGAGGLAVSKGTGTSTISAADVGSGLNDSTLLTVDAATLVDMAVTPNPATDLPVGAKEQFTANGIFSDGTAQDVSTNPGTAWSSSNTGAASVDTTGLVTAKAVATAITINATLSTISDATPPTINVTSATLVSIAVTPINASFAAGVQQQYTAIGTYSDSSTLDLTNQVTWSSTNTGAATITATGLASMVNAGQSGTIKAQFGTIIGQTNVTVTGATLTLIVVTPANPSVPLGSTQQFTATGHYSDGTTANITNQVAWATLDNTIALVSPGGLASTLKLGQTMVQAVQNGILGQTSITVTQPALVSIAITPASPTIHTNSVNGPTTVQLTATGVFSNNTRQDISSQVTWSSNNGKVSVSATGLVTAVSKGRATITAKQGTISGTDRITVKN